MPRPGRSTSRDRLPRPGRGLLLGALLLAAVEVWLHSHDFLMRYRSVFAAGRAFDKLRYAQQSCPNLLILGNSRADNGFDPKVIAQDLRLPTPRGIFNLGVPGADSRVLAGLLDGIDEAGCLRPGGLGHVVIALDEALLQTVDTLGQEVFFADRSRMLADGQYHDWLRSLLRLYGFSSNLRQLREPGTLQRFLVASRQDVEPVGGGAAQHRGYRAGFGGLQAGEAVARQEAGSLAPPNPSNIAHLWRMVDLLKSRGVQVAVAYPPLLNRDVLYRSDRREAAPYRAVAEELTRRGVPVLTLDDGQPRKPGEFVNAGHLNDRGAQRFSRLLAQALNRAWGAGQAALSTAVPGRAS